MPRFLAWRIILRLSIPHTNTMKKFITRRASEHGVRWTESETIMLLGFRIRRDLWSASP